MGRSGGSVAILGGGMAALTTAFELTEGARANEFDRVTVYQRGWRLGGKGASSRGPNGRIEEHGLHVLLGYYDHTFDVMRRCYDALDRGRSDPSCPIRTWDDAVAPSHLIGVVDEHDGAWRPWVARFSPVTGRPGETTDDPDPASPAAMADVVVRSLRLLVDFFSSLPAPDARAGGTIGFSTSPDPPGPRATAATGSLVDVVRGAGLLGLTLPLSWAERVVRQAGSLTGNRDLERALP
ncbi:MAG TPA: NAD(P)-binding protein, partial [Acidimicrobiales bacterium]